MKRKGGHNPDAGKIEGRPPPQSLSTIDKLSISLELNSEGFREGIQAITSKLRELTAAANEASEALKRFDAERKAHGQAN